MKTETENLRELDRWIAVNVFGWQEFREEEYPHRMLWREGEAGSPVWDEPDHYHEDPAAAMQVLTKCAEEKCDMWGLQIFPPHKSVLIQWTVREPYLDDLQNPVIAEADTLPIAICLFAKALYSK